VKTAALGEDQIVHDWHTCFIREILP
jgi:hypothetical protein